MIRQIAPVLGALLVAAPALAADEPPALTKEQIEQVVRDYLMREPEVVYEALQELQRRQAAAQAEQQRLAVVENRDALISKPSDPVAGNPDGDVTMVEFFDYRCSFCRRVVGSLQTLLDTDQDLRVVFKELPVLGEDSVRAARAALASQNQGAYLPFHFALMEAEDLSEAGILDLAETLGMDPEQLALDMYAPAVDDAIEANYALANELGIEGTPAFVIGENVVPGAIPKERMEELIREARAG